jgi:ketosteroid isomerase-like protein
MPRKDAIRMPNLTYDEARTRGKAWCDAWNDRNIDSVMDHYSADVALSSPLIAKRWGIEDGQLNGKERVRENFAIGMRTTGLHFTFVDVLLGVNAMCVLYRRETGALVCDLVELDCEGRGKRVTACHGEAAARPPD